MSGSPENPFRRLVEEVHRRSLWQTLGIYGVSAWAIFEMVQTLTEGLGLPKWFPALAFTLLLIGLPIVLATAFVQWGARRRSLDREAPAEVQGAPRRESARELQGRRPTHHVLTWRNAGMVGLGAAALWGLLAAGWLLAGGPPVPGTGAARETTRASIAVLPLDNMSPDPADAYFADGIHEEILAQLTKIGDLDVISRTSVMEYRGSNENLTRIAAELGVGNIVEGSVRKAADQVRITVQLIDARHDRHLWAETYDRRLTVANLLDIQADVAEAIAMALETELRPDERQRIQERPTENLEAYDLFLRGNEYFDRGLGDPGVLVAADMYERAVELDPSFLLGYAALAKADSRAVMQSLDEPERGGKRAREAAETALRLGPTHPAALAANGWYQYWVANDFAAALGWFEKAARRSPNDSDLLLGLGLAERRLALWDDAFAHLEQSFRLDPRSNEKAIEVGISYSFRHDCARAAEYFEKAIDLAPGQYRAYAHLSMAVVCRDGNLAPGLEVLKTGARSIGEEEFTRRMLSEQPAWSVQLWLLDALPEALEALPRSPLSSAQASYLYELLAEMSRRSHDAAKEGAYADSCLQKAPKGRWAGLAHARLGHRTEALALLETTPADLRINGRSYQEWVLKEGYAQLMLGDTAAALERLQYALTIPGDYSRDVIRVDPLWRSLRDNPRFRALVGR
jgi:TolB-like protein/Tfp pilus assembly protein PilF